MKNNINGTPNFNEERELFIHPERKIPRIYFQTN